ncbi:MAG: hypothetical protein LR011_14675, partial [Verrucomicrobia bacterium]|nr:hypothetical protein [Verrucomicrobiota bacterium]
GPGMDRSSWNTWLTPESRPRCSDLGWPDQFIEHATTVEYLRAKYGLTSSHLIERVQKHFERCESRNFSGANMEATAS